MEMAADLKVMAAGVFTKRRHAHAGRRHRRGHGARSLGRCRLRGRTWRGSTTGLGKAIAYQTDLPQIVIPTTYAGSEATWILGQTENGEKTTVTDPKVQPEVILYDAELVRTLPVR
jgi:maleylacetate reductase